jgi:hypothetical protein
VVGDDNLIAAALSAEKERIRSTLSGETNGMGHDQAPTCQGVGKQRHECHQLLLLGDSLIHPSGVSRPLIPQRVKFRTRTYDNNNHK